MPEITPPAYKEDGFVCPFCEAFSQQSWYDVHGYTGSSFVEFSRITLSRCERCANSGVWIDELLVYPMSEPAPMPSDDLSEDVKKDFLEARSIFTQSPRGAAALLRLCVQKLVIELGEPGKDLSSDIGALVKRGLLPRVQKALDAVRVIGNNAVHPGQINLDDTPETAFALFGLVNAITDQLITHPKQVDELYGRLPETVRQAIEERDSKD